MTSFEMFIIASLAVYRLTLMLNTERGPGDIFGKLRIRLGVRYDEYSKPYGKGMIAEGILCFYCLSTWIGIATALWLAVCMRFGRLDVGIALLVPFAFSGVAVYLKKAVG